MKYVFLNDTSNILQLHIASCIDKQSIQPTETVVVDIPEDTIPFIKLWDEDVVLLSYADKNAFNILE